MGNKMLGSMLNVLLMQHWWLLAVTKRWVVGWAGSRRPGGMIGIDRRPLIGHWSQHPCLWLAGALKLSGMNAGLIKRGHEWHQGGQWEVSFYSARWHWHCSNSADLAVSVKMLSADSWEICVRVFLVMSSWPELSDNFAQFLSNASLPSPSSHPCLDAGSNSSWNLARG